MAAMNVEYEGKTYLFDLEDMDTKDAEVMESAGIKNLKDLGERMIEGERVALTFAFWLMKRQNGSKARIESLQCKPLRFLRALDESVPVVDVEASGPKDPNLSDHSNSDS